jgi:hypothetical protein
MSQAAWVAVGLFAAVAILAFMALMAWIGTRRRPLPARIDGVRIEVLPARCVEDFILEREWRIPLIMRNVTKGPAAVPPLAARSVIRTARKAFAASTSLEVDAVELNPGSELIGWVDVRMPAEEVPRRITLSVLGSERRAAVALSAKLAYAHIG